MRQTAFPRAPAALSAASLAAALAAALAATLAAMPLPAHSQQAALSYGPTLTPRQSQAANPARKDAAEVSGEADSLARTPQQSQQAPHARQPQRRRPAWQVAGPLAPRPSRSADALPIGTGMVPVPAPGQAPEPLVPSIGTLNSCVGGACRDAAGGTYNLGPTGVGVSSSGRLCSTNGATVQCF